MAFRRLVEAFIIFPKMDPSIPRSMYYYQYSGIRANLNGAKEIAYTVS
jgi:hypothetical protein